MNGYYLTVEEKDGVGSCNLLRTTFQSFCKKQDLDKNTLYLFDEAPGAQILERCGWTLYAVGVLVFKNTWGIKALEKVLAELTGGSTLQDLSSSFHGQFNLVCHNDRGTSLMTDNFAAVPVYELKRGQQVHLSNILSLLLRFNRVSLDAQAVNEFLSTDFCLEGTLFQEINLVRRAQVIQLKPNVRRVDYGDTFSDLTFRKYREERVVEGLTKEALLENLSFLRPTDRIFADLTGGFDTRTATVLLKHLNVPFSTGICGEQVPGEAELAAEVAKALNLPFHADFRIMDRNVFHRTVDSHFSVAANVPVLYHSSELIHYYQRIQELFDIHVSGMAGTEVLTMQHPIRKTNLLFPKVDVRGIVERGFAYIDVLPDATMSRKKYYETLTGKVDRMLSGFASTRFCDVVNYLALTTYIAAHHSTLQGVHDCFVPLYSPYLERNVVRLLIQCSESLKHEHKIQRGIISSLSREASVIMTSHGYTAQCEFEPMRDLAYRTHRYVKGLVRRAAYHHAWSRRALDVVHNMIGSGKRELADSDRSFWVEEVRSLNATKLDLMGLLDRVKVRRLCEDPKNCNALLAKIAYIQRLIETYGVGW